MDAVVVTVKIGLDEEEPNHPVSGNNVPFREIYIRIKIVNTW
jgi:hypothetical protein